MDSDQVAFLVEANENLVRAVLQAHAQRALDEKKMRDLVQSAEHDVLTGLPNRRIVLDRMRHAIINAKRSGDRLAILFVDLNKFKHINDTLGHMAGDQVLKAAAGCMTRSVRESDTVCRHGGDEFVILLEQISTPSDVSSIVAKIFEALGEPHRIGPHMIRFTASVGISLYPDDGDDAEILLARADNAMYSAKRGGNARFAFAGNEKAEGINSSARSKGLPYEIASVEVEQRRAHRRGADEQLASATLAAQELQANAEQSLRYQTEFMATLAHELRNPLGPIRNAAAIVRQALSDTALASKIHDLLNRQVTHMTRLLDDVFDMSRIATGKMRIEHECVDVRTVVVQAIDGVRIAINLRQQKLSCTFTDNAFEIIGDPIRLVQIFVNLLDNASKYTPEDGSITIAVHTNATSVVVTISDTGIGITREALPAIFEFFRQDAHAIQFNGRGLGIGLALVKDLVEAHHGAVTAHSDGAGLGSQFTVTLPRAPQVADSSI